METSSITVMIVDDDADNVDVVSTALKKEGYSVRAAYNLAEGRALATAVEPQLLILDRNLPDGDGLELCKEFRQHPTWRFIPILFLSVKDSVKERVHGLDEGADDYLPKPFGVKELQARVMALLRRARLSPPTTKPKGKDKS